MINFDYNAGMRQYAQVPEFAHLVEPEPVIQSVPSKDNSRRRARRLYRKLYTRPIPHGWHVHHIDGNALNNTPNNLLCVSVPQHIALHQEIGDLNAVNFLKSQLKTTLPR